MTVTLTPVEIHVGCKVCGQSDRYTGPRDVVEITGQLWFMAHRAPLLLAVTFMDCDGSTWERRTGHA